MQGFCQQLDLLEFTVFYRPSSVIINAIVVSEPDSLSLKVLGACRLVNTLDVPACRLSG